jgi:transketolase
MADTLAFARRLRAHVLRMIHRANASHVGSCLSAADIVATLYGEMLHVDPQQPDDPARDRFILSKGHAGAVVYAALALRGFFPLEWLDTYGEEGSRLFGHLTRSNVPGVDLSTGALGHGLAVGCGMALAARADRRATRVHVVLSDGECDEGSTWEAALFAPHHKIDNLVAVIDYNKIQSFGTVHDVLDLEPLADKWRACRWHVLEVDGHDHPALLSAFRTAMQVQERPTMIIAHTVKGKGVSYMEAQLAWHYRSPNVEQLRQALVELGEEP